MTQTAAPLGLSGERLTALARLRTAAVRAAITLSGG